MFGEKGFVKDAATLTVGTALAQFVPMLVYPILSRRFTPEDFALLATFTSIVNILQVLVTGKYEAGILVAKTEKESNTLISLTMLLSIVMALFSIVFFVLLGNHLGKSVKSLGYWLYLTPFVAVFVGIYNVYNEWCIRKREFKKLSINKMTYSFTTTAGKIGLSFERIRSIGLLLGDILGKFITACVCIARVIAADAKAFKDVSVQDMKCSAVANKEFPLYIMPAQLLNSIGGSFPVLLLGSYYNQAEVGFFSMTTIVLSIPISIISYSIRDVFRQKANEDYQRQGEFKSLFGKIFIRLSLITLAGCLLIVWFLPYCFSFVLGQEWFQSGVYAQIMLPMIAVDFVAMSLSGVFIVVGKLRVQLIWQIIYCVSTIIVLVVGGILFNDIKITLWLFSISRVIVYGLMIGLSAHYAKGK